MKRALRGLGLVATSAMLIALGAQGASADQITNTIDAIPDSAIETKTVEAGSSATVGFSLLPANNALPGDPVNGCNAGTGGQSPPVVVTINVPAAVTASRTQLTFTSCDDPQSIDFSSSVVATHHITVASVSGGKSGGAFDRAPGAFDLVVTAPAGDSQKPVIASHPDVTAEATSAAGALVTYTSPATTDNVDPNGTAACSPASGTQFALGDTTVTCTAKDVAGNSAVPTTFKVTVADSTAPVIADHATVTENAAGPAGATVTYASPATSDAVDGVGTATCAPASGTVFTLGSHTVTCTAEDAAGNAASSTQFTVKVVDPSAPVVTPHVAGTEGDNGWYTSDVTVSWTVSDGESAITSTTGCDTTVVIKDTSGTTFTCSATSQGGTSSESVTIKRDTVAPSVSVVLDRAAAASGWFNSATGAPTAVVTCDDETSGLSSCSPDKTFGEGADQSYTATATDAAGNNASDAVSNVDVDTVAPSVSVVLDRAAAASGWFNSATGAPTADVTCDDETSGLSSCTPDKTFGDGADQSYTATATDAAGNSASDSVSNVDVDTVAPSVSVVLDRAAAASGWFNSATGAPTADVTCDDETSGLSSCTPDKTFGDGADQSFTATATDAAGNSASDSVSNVDVDTVAPSVSVVLDRAAAASGWFNSATGAPTADVTCDDETSGLSSCTPDKTFGDGADQSFTATATDAAGNNASDSVTNVDVDTVAPGITWNGGPLENGSYYFDYVPAAPTCTATDSLSGAGTCTVGGYGTAIGGHSMTATAHDLAGNTTTQTRAYSVAAWSNHGFYQPVDMGVLNLVKGGSTVPLKFEVFAGTELTSTSAVSSFKVGTVSCGGLTGTPTDDIEQYSTGGTTLRYDTTGGQFIQNWQVPKGAGICYKVVMTTRDGGSLTATFKTK